MLQPTNAKDPFFTPFNASIDAYSVPARFTFPFDDDPKPHVLSILATAQLQEYLIHQQDWKHNFGLSDTSQKQDGIIVGKMFGVLVVQTASHEPGYLAAFSGKLAGGNHHTAFVPPVFDSLSEDGFLNRGMTALTLINQQIKALQDLKPDAYEEHILILKEHRKKHSAALQEKLFESYHFLNQSGEEKSLRDIFGRFKQPPSGAGECAAPKLLHYAFQHQMKPIAMAEFWWGISPKSDIRKHGQFYPSCMEKCEPILKHMLEGIELEERRR